MRYCTYIMTNPSRTLYVGVTGNLRERVGQHARGEGGAFTSRYKCIVLVWFEEFANVKDAIAREKQIKGWTRAKKVALIESVNPRWEDWGARL